MALVLIHGPDNAPSTSADWDKINDVLQTIGLDINSPTRISGTKILRGSVILFAGAWYVADADTAITGSVTNYVRLTNSAGTVTAAFVASLSGVSFNRTWNGWYDSSMRLYLFDEMKALAAGSITELATNREWRVSKNWAKALTRNLSTANLNKLFTLDSPVTLTGSGTYTVPEGVYFINYQVRGPGANGLSGSSGGAGGDAGQVVSGSMEVEPGQEITYIAGTNSTIFGAITALKGLGESGGSPSAYDSGGGTLAYRGGRGGGTGGGAGGTAGKPGANATANTGGGGGGGGGRVGSGGTPPGGTGATGNIRLS